MLQPSKKKNSRTQAEKKEKRYTKKTWCCKRKRRRNFWKTYEVICTTSNNLNPRRFLLRNVATNCGYSFCVINHIVIYFNWTKFIFTYKCSSKRRRGNSLSYVQIRRGKNMLVNLEKMEHLFMVYKKRAFWTKE